MARGREDLIVGFVTSISSNKEAWDDGRLSLPIKSEAKINWNFDEEIKAEKYAKMMDEVANYLCKTDNACDHHKQQAVTIINIFKNHYNIKE